MKASFIILFFSVFVNELFAQNTLPDYLKSDELQMKNATQSLQKEFVLIEGGTFLMEGEAYKTPSKRVTISSFFIQKHEVTNRWYRYFIYDLAKTDIMAAVKMIPDTNSWVSDFSYSYNEPMKLLYFKHAAYDNYPVVGVNYHQATAFAAWANEKLKMFVAANNIKNAPVEIHLPTEAEWQYAAAAGLEKYQYGFEPTSQHFSGNGVFVLYDSKKNKFRANYKTDEGYFIGDGFFHTAPVASYAANNYGLFDMIGNVSEWTADTFHKYEMKAENGDYNSDVPNDKIKVIKGGSWVDDYKNQRINISKPLDADSAHCFVGFRLAANLKK